MTLRDEISSIHEMAHMGEWDVANLEDRDLLFNNPISPEKACFIGSVCAHDALDDLRELRPVSDSSAATSLEAFAELDADYDFDDLINKLPSNGLKRLVVAKMFWEMRTQGEVDGHMFVSAEQEDHDLVGEIDGSPTVWKVCDTKQQLNGYELVASASSMLVARMPFVVTPDKTPDPEFRQNRLPGAMSLSRLSLV